MAGMLPGVEAARRRRVHHHHHLGITPSQSPSSSSRRSSFSLFSPNSSSSLSPQARISTYQNDEKLGAIAREAKERLDEKLRAQRKPLFTRNNSDLLSEEMPRRGNQLRTEVYGSSSTKRLKGWAKLGWKSGEQQECAVCLDVFKVGENLVNLPCAHKFHSRCLVPWIHTSAHCPCCRISIFS